MVQKKISITLSQACEGMLLNKQAEGRSAHIITVVIPRSCGFFKTDQKPYTCAPAT